MAKKKNRKNFIMFYVGAAVLLIVLVAGSVRITQYMLKHWFEHAPIPQERDDSYNAKRLVSDINENLKGVTDLNSVDIFAAESGGWLVIAYSNGSKCFVELTDLKTGNAGGRRSFEMSGEKLRHLRETNDGIRLITDERMITIEPIKEGRIEAADFEEKSIGFLPTGDIDVYGEEMAYCDEGGLYIYNMNDGSERLLTPQLQASEVVSDPWLMDGYVIAEVFESEAGYLNHRFLIYDTETGELEKEFAIPPEGYLSENNSIVRGGKYAAKLEEKETSVSIWLYDVMKEITYDSFAEIIVKSEQKPPKGRILNNIQKGLVVLVYCGELMVYHVPL